MFQKNFIKAGGGVGLAHGYSLPILVLRYLLSKYILKKFLS